MPIPVKFNTGSQIVMFGPFLDDTDGKTNETGLAISAGNILLHKKNAVSTVIHSLSGATHKVSGLYVVTLGTGDTNAHGPMTMFIDVTGALSERLEILVMEANAYDAQFAALGTGYIQSDVQLVDGDGTAAANLNSACDNYSATRGLTGTALPAVAADGAGGVPVSDAGGLDLDTQLATTDQIGAAGAGLTDLGGMSVGMKGEVNAEVDTALVTTTYGEPGDEIPAATSSLGNKIDYIFKFLRNKVETTSTRIHVYDDAGTNKDHSSTISDDSTTFTRGEFRAGDA